MMNINVKKIALAEQISNNEDNRLSTVEKPYLNRIESALESLALSASVRLGSFTIRMAELKQLATGQIFSLEQKTDEPVDILLNNQVIARGELLAVNEHFAIKITEVCLS